MTMSVRFGKNAIINEAPPRRKPGHKDLRIELETSVHGYSLMTLDDLTDRPMNLIDDRESCQIRYHKTTMGVRIMTSRERVWDAINHREADRVPIDLGGMGSTGISAIAYKKLREYLGLQNKPVKLYDVMQQLAWPDDDLLEHFGADVRQVRGMYSSFGIRAGAYKQGALLDGTPALVPDEYNPEPMMDGSIVLKKNGRIIAVCPANGNFFEECLHPYENVDSEAGIDAMPTGTLSDENLDCIRENAENLYHNTSYSLMGTFNGNVFEAGLSDWGFERFMILLGEEPDLAHYYLERKTDSHLKNLELYLAAAGDYIDIIKFGDDLGSQNAPLISPNMYREIIKPYHKKQYQMVKRLRPDIKVFLHSCGAISTLIPDLIDAGVDILNPIQISAKGMDPSTLKKKFGKNLVFWGGGSNTQTTLAFGTPENVTAETESLVKTFAPDGGYVFSQVHNILPNVKPENIAAMYRAATIAGKY